MKVIEEKEFEQYLEELQCLVNGWKVKGHQAETMRSDMSSILCGITDKTIAFTVEQLQKIFELI